MVLATTLDFYYIIVYKARQEKRGDIITDKKKMGRPTTKSRNKSLHLRISEEEHKMIEELSEKLNLSRTDVIMAGLDLLKENND